MVIDHEAALVALLAGSEVLADFVGSRIYADITPPTCVFPLVVYELVSASPERALTGASTVDDARWQLDIWALTHESAKAVSEAVRTALDGQHSPQGSPQYAFGLSDHRASYNDGFGLYHATQTYAMQLEAISA